jgi:transporter family-2 protein
VTQRSHSRQVQLALAVAVVSGSLVAVQQRINGELGTELGDALAAAVVSFGTGLVAVTAYVLLRPATRGAVRRLRDTAWWERLGGLGGASLVAVGAAAAPEIGVARLTVGIVAGQTGGGVLGDRGGLGPGGARPVTGPRLAGAALCMVAVVIAGFGKGVEDVRPLLLVLVVVAGVLISVQQALNGRVRVTTGDAGVATLLNFVVGTTALLVGLAVHAAVSGLDLQHWPGPGEWYLYLGGPIGASFVAAAAVTVHLLGVLRLGLAVVAGQLLGAVALDAAVPAPGTGLAASTLIGALLTLLAVAVSGRPPR